MERCADIRKLTSFDFRFPWGYFTLAMQTMLQSSLIPLYYEKFVVLALIEANISGE